jgi:membrane protein implicated in regulation of membrane protease activity
MTDLLISTIIAGSAVTYAVEFIELITKGFFGVVVLNKYITLPLNIGALFILGNRDLKLIASAPAATLVALLISKYLNKPVAVTRQLPRL